jgi:deoxyribodipyrimidine photo-lyase
MNALFLFRRDLRIIDNLSFHHLIHLPNIQKITPLFIFDPFQIDKTPENREYRSVPAIQFLISSLHSLDNQLKESLNARLLYFYDSPIVALEKIWKKTHFNMIAFNRDFSEYSMRRDQEIIDWCNSRNIQVITDTDSVGAEDLTLHPMQNYLSPSNKPYVIYGAYYKNAMKLGAPADPIVFHKSAALSKKFVTGRKKIPGEFPPNKINDFINPALPANYIPVCIGGRDGALEILRQIRGGKWANYADMRDDLAYETTHLSSYMKFGCVSIREVYAALQESGTSKSKIEALTRQLYWRCFFFMLARYYHRGYGHSDEFFANVKWRNNVGEARQMWVDAKTGFPVIDACVRELLTTGYLHNRGRLLVANFSIKMLQIDPFHPQWGGQVVFSRLLMDNCYANNYGNWNNALGPYDLPGFRFGKKGTRSGRIFRDIVKFQKWDRTLAYIRRYLPELADVPEKDIYRWNTQWKKYQNNANVDYPKPMIDFDERIREYFEITKR